MLKKVKNYLEIGTDEDMENRMRNERFEKQQKIREAERNSKDNRYNRAGSGKPQRISKKI